MSYCKNCGTEKFFNLNGKCFHKIDHVKGTETWGYHIDSEIHCTHTKLIGREDYPLTDYETWTYYNKLNQVIKFIERDHDQIKETSYTYDDNDNLVKIERDHDPICEIFQYDENGNIIEHIDSNENVFTYKYNKSGLCTDVDMNGINTHYDYDEFGRVLKKTVGTTTNTYGYDNKGYINHINTISINSSDEYFDLKNNTPKSTISKVESNPISNPTTSKSIAIEDASKPITKSTPHKEASKHNISKKRSDIDKRKEKAKILFSSGNFTRDEIANILGVSTSCASKYVNGIIPKDNSKLSFNEKVELAIKYHLKKKLTITEAAKAAGVSYSTLNRRLKSGNDVSKEHHKDHKDPMSEALDLYKNTNYTLDKISNMTGVAKTAISNELRRLALSGDDFRRRPNSQKNNALPGDKVNEIIYLHKQGITQKDIANQVGVSLNSVNVYLKINNLL